MLHLRVAAHVLPPSTAFIVVNAKTTAFPLKQIKRWFVLESNISDLVLRRQS